MGIKEENTTVPMHRITRELLDNLSEVAVETSSGELNLFISSHILYMGSISIGCNYVFYSCVEGRVCEPEREECIKIILEGVDINAHKTKCGFDNDLLVDKAAIDYLDSIDPDFFYFKVPRKELHPGLLVYH